ncbi:MAG TPA: DUF3560 domain-containing protein [Solirubrobacteraceae bacterium]
MSQHSTHSTSDSNIAVDIVNAIAGQPGLTVPEIAVKLGVSLNVLYREMPRIADAIVQVNRRFYPPGHQPESSAPAAARPSTAPAVETSAELSKRPDAPSATLSITHTNEEGTLVHGTQRDDGSKEALRRWGYKWSRHLGAWYMPSSRGRAAKRARIECLRGELQTAGFTVEVEIERYDAAQAFETLQTHGEERADLHAGRAAREETRSDARYQASNDAVRGIEPGQPILRGHHSQGRHERDLARSHQHMSASVAHSRNAQRAAGRAAEVQRRTQRRENPVVMGRRVERLEANQRDLERRLQGAGEAPVRRAELEDVKEEIAFLKAAIADSGVKQYTRADLKAGDLVQIRGRWMQVAKANLKTVAVKTAYSWTDKYPYHEIAGHERPTESPSESQ